MFALLNPSALLALLGLLVPVAIHLWNRRPGREVAVGSLRWLAAGANRRLRNLKPEQLWLFLLRATVLTVLAVALAEPVWQQALPAGRGQVLVSPELLANPALEALRPAIDSLRRRGYALRWLAPGFPKVSGAAWRAADGPRDSAAQIAGADQATGLRWARVQQAAGAFPGQPLFVVTPAALRGLQGPHAPLGPGITWQLVPTAAADTWVQAAAVRGDSLCLLLGHSTERQTSFRLLSVARPQPGGLLRVAGLAALRLTAGAGPGTLRLVGTAPDTARNAPPLLVSTQPLRIVLYSTPAYAPDARYLQAGLRAAAAGLTQPLALSTTMVPPNPDTAPDWLFWLSDAPLPAAWRRAARAGTQVWQAAAGPGVADTAHLATTASAGGPVAVFRRDNKEAAAGTAQPLWADAQGRAVLARQALGQGALYRLHTRLNPTWSELADDPELPARLLRLLQPALTDAPNAPVSAADLALATHDQRALDPAQLAGQSLLPSPPKTNRAPPAATAVPRAYRRTDLRPWWVLAAGLLFALERLLARRREAEHLPSSI